jgi:hypothetical protein
MDAVNPLGSALMAPMLDDPVSRRNIARFTFEGVDLPASQGWV